MKMKTTKKQKKNDKTFPDNSKITAKVFPKKL